MRFKPFDKQIDFLKSKARIRGAFAGRRGGKTEVGAIEAIIHAEQKTGYKVSDVDPYLGVIIAPTHDMLRRISLKKFLAYAKPFNPTFNKSSFEISWPNKSVIYGISADRPERLEGLKANWIWLDEVFQMPEQIFLEAMARVADTQGRIWCTGSLGIQYITPKRHWIYKHFIKKPVADSEYFTWATAENPYFPQAELERLKDTLDARTYKALFELNWDAQGENLVYDDFDDSNVAVSPYNPLLETSVSIDWGYTHKAVALFLQYDPRNEAVYVIDEIAQSKLKLETLYSLIMAKPYKIHKWYCDIAGSQEREQTGISNIAWFKQAPRNIHFTYRTSGIMHGVSIMRSYILNAKGQRRFFIDPRCENLIDGMRNYKYPTKDGMIVGELPEKKDDDCVDAARYYFVNRLDFTRPKDTFNELNRWKVLG